MKFSTSILIKVHVPMIIFQFKLRLPYTFKGRFFSKKNFTAKLNITSLPSFSKKNYFKTLKRARVINKNVFSSETQYTRQRVISQLKCVSVMTSWDVFRCKRFGVFHFMWRPLLLFTLAICDLFTPSFRLCWSLLHLYVQKKKENSPWLKVKKKTGLFLKEKEEEGFRWWMAKNSCR